MHLWKWCSCMSFLNLLISLIVTTFYWLLLYPKLHGNQKEATFKEKTTHSWPLIMISIDWLLNRIGCEFHQIVVMLVFIFIYGVVNFSYTKITGEKVYPGFTWNSRKSWAIGLSLLPITAIFYTLIFGLTCLKFKILEEKPIKGDSI